MKAEWLKIIPGLAALRSSDVHRATAGLKLEKLVYCHRVHKCMTKSTTAKYQLDCTTGMSKMRLKGGRYQLPTNQIRQ